VPSLRLTGNEWHRYWDLWESLLPSSLFTAVISCYSGNILVLVKQPGDFVTYTAESFLDTWLSSIEVDISFR